jgi:hypothetical protein
MMIAIVGTRETFFFSHEAGTLCQWIMVTIESRLAAPARGTLAIAAGGEEVVTALEVAPGVHEYRCHAPTLWPDHALVVEAPVRLVVGGEVATGSAPVGHHRPWTIYVLADVCTDYTWVYGSEQEMRADDAELTEAELRLAEATRDCPGANRNRYNMAVGRQGEFYLERYPQHAERLFDHIRRGNVTLNPFFNMALTGVMSLEELIRQLYPARQWALEQGLDISCANHQETPAITWAMATVLAQSGIRYLVKGNLPYECPWAKRLEEPPLFLWEGPDGSRVLYRRRNEDYVEARFLLRDLRATNTALHTQIIPDYEALGERYPFSAIALVGCYGDLSAQTREMGARKMATITAYNAQGWEYPRLVSASHQMFWADVEAQVAALGVELPAYRGDYGVGWEAWPASLACDFAGWRRAQERAGTADKLAAILSLLDRGWYDANRNALAEGWMNLIYLADHAWNGANDANIELNAVLRRRWQLAANEAFDGVISSGLAALGRRVPTGSRREVLAFNSLGWSRTAIARIAGLEAGSRLVDAATGQPVPTQAVEEEGQPVLCFEARDVPSVGYRTFTVQPGGVQEAPASPFQVGPNRLEGPFYALEVSPVTGGIVSLYDKVRGRELVDPASPYHLNQCLYLSEGVENRARAARVEVGDCGPVFARLVVRAALKSTHLTTTITLYAGLDRVDIANALEKAATSEKQELDFAFPLQVPGRRYRLEAPGAIIDPEADLLPGAGHAAYAVRHFVDAYNDQFGVTLSQADSGIVELGHRTTAEDPLGPDLTNSTVLAMALDSSMDWNEANRNQGGATRFCFRYSLRGHGPGFDPVAAVRFGWDDNNPLEAIVLPAGQAGDLPAAAHSFLTVEPGHAILTCLKVAEEQGLIVRLWECAGEGEAANLSATGLGMVRQARQTDLLERDRQALPVTEGQVSAPMRPRGLTSVRLLFETP